MKADAYSHLYSFSAGFEQAWEAIQKLQPHLELTRSNLKEIYFRIQEARFATLVVLTELSSGYERAAVHRIREQKARWEGQEEERDKREQALMRGKKLMRHAGAEGDYVEKRTPATGPKTKRRKSNFQ